MSSGRRLPVAVWLLGQIACSGAAGGDGPISAGAADSGVGAEQSGGAGSGGSSGASAPTGGAGASSGQGGLSGNTSGQVLCERGCAVTDGLCSGDVDVMTCVAHCQAQLQPSDDLGCNPEVDLYMSCLVTQPLRAFVCDPDGKSALREEFCVSVRDDLVQCLTLAQENLPSAEG